MSGSSLGAARAVWAGHSRFRFVVLSNVDASFEPYHPCPLPLAAA